MTSAIRRRWKRWRWARQRRSLEAYLFNYAPGPTWSRARKLNDLARVWRRA